MGRLVARIAASGAGKRSLSTSGAADAADAGAAGDTAVGAARSGLVASIYRRATDTVTDTAAAAAAEAAAGRGSWARQLGGAAGWGSSRSSSLELKGGSHQIFSKVAPAATVYGTHLRG